MPRPRKSAEQTTSSMYRGADGSWHARVTMGRRPDGKIQRRHVQRRTKSELRDAVRELERSRDSGDYVWTTDDLTLAAWLERWLENVLPMTARWKTLSTYRSQMRLHIVPAIGPWRISEIQPEHLEAHYRRMQTDRHSAHTIRAVHRVLRTAFNEAVRRGRLAGNPALIARPPRVEDVEVEPLSIAESRRVLQELQVVLEREVGLPRVPGCGGPRLRVPDSRDDVRREGSARPRCSDLGQGRGSGDLQRQRLPHRVGY